MAAGVYRRRRRFAPRPPSAFPAAAAGPQTYEESIALGAVADTQPAAEMVFAPAVGLAAELGLAPAADVVFEPALSLAASLDAATAAEAVIDHTISLAATLDMSQVGGLALDESLDWAASLGDGNAGALTIIEAASFPASLTAPLAHTLDINGAASYGATLTFTGGDGLIPGGPEIFEEAVSFFLTLNAPMAGVIPTGAIPRDAATPATPRSGGTVTAEGGSAGAATGRGPGTPATTR